MNCGAKHRVLATQKYLCANAEPLFFRAGAARPPVYHQRIVEGKYQSRAQYLYAKARRVPLRAVLRPLVRWKSSPLADGYTIIIACVGDLPSLLLANLQCLARLQLGQARELILVFDHEPTGGMDALELQIRAIDLPIAHRIFQYNRLQRAVADHFYWASINAWMSWSIGIAATSTRHAVLHDLDAMLISNDFLRDRHEQMLREPCEYLGTHWYHGAGVTPADRLLTTFELFFDASYVRQRFDPIDLFNQEIVFNGKSVDFDTFLYAQSRGGRLRRIDSGVGMVHPGQLLTQYLFWRAGDHRLELGRNNLLMLLYFLWLGNQRQPMLDATQAMMHDRPPRLDGKIFPIHGIEPAHLDWIIEQVHRLETGLAGQIRPEVEAFTRAIRHTFSLAHTGASAYLVHGA